ncbi:ABC transporter permease [Fulvivirga sp. RKSG066]|nr:ABC transporter permease [Fulvivirga aurantia]
MLIVAICTAALIIVLSVFNGLEGLLRSLYGSFDPQIKVELKEGKSFVLSDSLKTEIEETEGVEILTEVIEDYAYVMYREADMVVTIKGVSDNFLDQHRLDSSIVSGELKLKDGNVNYAIIGRGVQYALSIMINNDLHPLKIHFIKDVKPGSIDVSNLYSSRNILPGGVFAIEKNYDENYIFVPLDFAESLLNYGDKRTSLEIKTDPDYDIGDVKANLKATLGDQFSILDNEEQHADLYKILKLEKLFVFIAFSFILAIGAINIFFALTMLALDKKKDISILFAMGANNQLIKSIFLAEGAIISLGGAAMGLLIGGVICWAQQTFGLISMGMETSVLENYPVEMQLMDFIYTSLSLILITVIISYRPAVIATRYNNVEFL